MRQTAADIPAVQEVSQVMLGNGIVPEPDLCAVYAEPTLRRGLIMRVTNFVMNRFARFWKSENLVEHCGYATWHRRRHCSEFEIVG
jgi:hypothetical protein